MIVLTPERMAKYDGYAINTWGVPSAVLMENAGIRSVEMTKELLGSITGKKVIILAGRGNNGGDGLVAARHLHSSGAVPIIFVMGEIGLEVHIKCVASSVDV